MLIVLVLLAVIGGGVWYYFDSRPTPSSVEILPPDPRLDTFEQTLDEDAPTGPNQFRVREEGELTMEEYFADEVQGYYIENVGQPIEGIEPGMLLTAFPGLVETDFIGVEAEQGIYVYDEETEEFSFELTLAEDEAEHSAARAITDPGFATLLNNVVTRTEQLADTTRDIDRLVGLLAASGGEFGVEG